METQLVMLMQVYLIFIHAVTDLLVSHYCSGGLHDHLWLRQALEILISQR